MLKSRLETTTLMSMARAAADPRTVPAVKALDMLRVADEFTAHELALCTAFDVNPLDYLIARETQAAQVAEERQERKRLEEFRERERQQRERFTVT